MEPSQSIYIYSVKPYLNTEEAAEFLSTSPKVLRTSRHTGSLFGRPSPLFFQVGETKVLYKTELLSEWIESAPALTMVGAA